MCSDERKCAVMKGVFCNDELHVRRNEKLACKSRKRDVEIEREMWKCRINGGDFGGDSENRYKKLKKKYGR